MLTSDNSVVIPALDTSDFIATTATRAGLTLVSRDRRAAGTYAAVGADCRLLPS